METFIDEQGGRVTVSFQKDSFAQKASHVLVICRFYDQWLLTKHKERGWEFPGGKKEENETLEEAAKREVEEETGARLKSLQYIGEYEVASGGSFVKAIFYAEVENLLPKEGYFETNGPVLIGGDLLTLRFQDSYSFIMKDKVIELALEKAALLEKV
ncbi:nucleoside triphosphatase YtkD [Niallia oryzisoli]|uniref:Nucleoside triphosphatase YtkD n=1 Tax=Niallia oryzisoli TaxID=1737571 RepID=A0ABZ2CCL6_9BACI